MTDCIYVQNPNSGFVGSHNHRCSRGLTSPDIHLNASHHARIGGWCGRVCDQCSRELASKRGKEVVIRPLTTEEQIVSKGTI